MSLRPFSFFLFIATLAFGQAPRIGTIDFYGLHRVQETKLRQALGAREGDPLPPSKGNAEERLVRVPGVIEAHLEAVCCDTGKMILYVGIEEKGAGHFDLRDEPDGAIRLPEAIVNLYRQFLEAAAAAARKGEIGEDLTHGHSLLANPEARAIQEQFVPLVKDHLKEIREVLRDSEDDEQRAAAAFVIGYAPKKNDVLNDLQYALRDPEASVRTNATRSLTAMAVLARLDPKSGLKISPTWFIEMLNSLSWTDRDRALHALQILTDSRDPEVIEQLRQRALPALVEMARWKTLEHALPAYILLGRVAGLKDREIEDVWSRGEREKVIAQASLKKK